MTFYLGNLEFYVKPALCTLNTDCTMFVQISGTVLFPDSTSYKFPLLMRDILAP